MKLLELIIKPQGPFASRIKADTLFGQFCWQIAESHDLLGVELETLLSDYAENPFVVFSSAFPSNKEDGHRQYLVPRPKLPPKKIAERSKKERLEAITKRKEEKAKSLVSIGKSLCIDTARLNLREPKGESNVDLQHNTIDRRTWTTGEGQFAPFSKKAITYARGTELCIFALFDESRCSCDGIAEGIRRIGQFGYAGDASTGCGRFELSEHGEIGLPDLSVSDVRYALSPFVPEADSCRDIYFTPFVRYGRHGSILARSENPFKNPVLMADEGAVLCLNKEDAKGNSKPYLGKAITGVSRVQREAVAQGYAICLPVTGPLEEA